MKKRKQLFKQLGQKIWQFWSTQACLELYCRYASLCKVELFLQAKPKGPKDILENCQTHEHEQATNPCRTKAEWLIVMVTRPTC